MTEYFVPFNKNPRYGARSAKIGWVVRQNGCHEWTGWLSDAGYGYVWTDGKNRIVHRVRYEREVGPIPEGMHLDHFACDNPACCNPAHVRPASPRENVLRSKSFVSANAAKTHCPRGHRYTPNNLTKFGLKRGERICLKCHREYGRAYLRRWRASKSP